MRRADLVFCTGAQLEIGWLPILLKKAGGPDVQPGGKGWLMAAEHVEMLDVPATVDRSMGDIHPDGNPHVHTDPRNLLPVAAALAERLAALDPENAGTYRANAARFTQDWQKLTRGWEAQAAPLKGQKVVVYHKNWAYLLNWLGLQEVAALEPKPGIPPTAAHLEQVLGRVQGQEILAILVAPFENPDAAEWLAERTGAPVLRLPYTVGGSDAADSLPALYGATIARLMEAARR